MSNQLNHNIDVIRAIFNEAKNLLNQNQINILEYRSLIRTLLSDVKEIDKNYNNEDIREVLNKFINNEKDKTTKR